MVPKSYRHVHGSKILPSIGVIVAMRIISGCSCNGIENVKMRSFGGRRPLGICDGIKDVSCDDIEDAMIGCFGDQRPVGNGNGFKDVNMRIYVDRRPLGM